MNINTQRKVLALAAVAFGLVTFLGGIGDLSSSGESCLYFPLGLYSVDGRAMAYPEIW
jgi:hypothetical protein